MSALSEGEKFTTKTSPEDSSETIDSPLARLKKYSGRLAVTAILSSTLLLGACGDSTNDCIPSTPPPTQPASSGFTAAKPSSSSGTYCRSRSTGGYYYSSGSSYSSSGSSSS